MKVIFKISDCKMKHSKTWLQKKPGDFYKARWKVYANSGISRAFQTLVYGFGHPNYVPNLKKH